MIMTSSPILTPHTRSMVHTPSPSASPKLVPVASTMASNKSNALPSPSMPTSASPMTSTSLPTRSFARVSERRPYASQRAKEVAGDVKQFAELVANTVHDRASNRRKGELIEMIENVSLDDTKPSSPTRAVNVNVNANSPHRTRSVAGSMGGSWEVERAELIVDIPVWSPGCFQDLSTLHALRDTTLSHTHALLNHLHNAHTVPATYRLLARSCGTSGHSASPYSNGWGCIRLAPSITSPLTSHSQLRPNVRRTSLVHAHSLPHVHTLKKSQGKDSTTPSKQTEHHHDNCHESVIIDSDDEADGDVEVQLRERYSGGSVSSDSEDEEETADALVAKEIEKRGGKEGMAFLMTLFGQPALILT